MNRATRANEDMIRSPNPSSDSEAGADVGGTLSSSPTLSPAERRTLRAAISRLIPNEDGLPGAEEAQVWRYVSGELLEYAPSLASIYKSNLQAIDRFAEARHGCVFGELDSETCDGLLRDIEDDRADGFEPSSASFFRLLREHSWQGMFGDPFYGGNQDLVGWKLVGFPGLRPTVTAAEQEVDTAVLWTGTGAGDLHPVESAEEE